MPRTTTSQLKPISVSPRLHKKTKLIATLEDKDISEVAEELYMPVAERRADELMLRASRNGGKR